MMESLRASNWYLEGLFGNPPSLRQVAINTWPFRIGRRADLSFCLAANGVSKEHAEIRRSGAGLVISDLGSKNGTFVNGRRIDSETPIKNGDVLHFANQEFRLGYQDTADSAMTMQVDRSEWVWSIGQFEKLFDPGSATPFYQPIVSLPDGAVRGYEVLARSSLDGLRSPAQMFTVATRLNMEAALSRLFRREGVRQAMDLPGHPNLFLNTHPAELADEGLLESLVELRESAPDQVMTLEIHEAAITDLAQMRSLREELRKLHIQIAYDDFGAGQARLVDLIEVPPDFLKFDICLVRDIHTGSDQRRQMLETLVRMAHDLGVAVLAEGIECQGESDVCAQLGFDFAQGYYFGKPAPLTQPVGA
jgi:EAL domain-containing protein (putative c-di-GMP-specific phosphodiesterase class I)